MESNSIKIAIKNKEFVINLNEGESIYLELTNKNDNIYLSDVPKKNNENMYEEDVFEDFSKIKLEPVPKTHIRKFGINKDPYQSAIFDVLKEKPVKNDEESEKVSVKEPENKGDPSDVVLNETMIENESNNDLEGFNIKAQSEDALLEVSEDKIESESEEFKSESYEDFKSRYLDFDDE